MKLKLLYFSVFLFIVGLSLFSRRVFAVSAGFSGGGQTEVPIKEIGTSFCINVTSNSWTVIPTSNLAGRSGLFLGANYAQLNGNITGILTSSSDTPSLSTNTAHISWPGSAGNFTQQDISISDDVYLWLRTDNASDEPVCGIEYKK